MNDKLVIDMNARGHQCCVCGEWDETQWGLPIGPHGAIVSNDWVGDWAGKPACRKCWQEHEEGGLVGQYPSY